MIEASQSEPDTTLTLADYRPHGAELKAACRAVGHGLAQKVHDADRWIAATAIARDLDLISDDAVFEQVPGLSLVTTRSS